MIKNKSLAVVSTGLLALASLVAATPAQAAGELKLEALSGVGYNVPHTSEFELRTSVTAGNNSDELVALKYKIETGGNVNVLGDSGDATLAAGASPLVQDTESSAVYADDQYEAGDVVNVLALKIETAADAAFALDADNVSITVTAFVDKDGDGVIDADEWQASQTITWVDSDNISTTTILKQPSIGDESVSATVAAAGINLAQSSNIWFVDFTEDDDSDGTAEATADNSTATYDADDNVLEFATTADATADGGTRVPDTGGDGSSDNNKVVAGIYGAQAQFTGDVNIGSKSNRTVSAADIDGITLAAAAGSDNEALDTNDIDARSGSGSLTVKYTADNGGTAVEDKVLTLVVQENGIASLDSGASVTVNGQTLKNTSAATKQKVTTTGTTDADGEVEFVISWTGTVKTNKLDLIVSADGISETDTITFEDAAATTVYNLDVTGTTTSELYFVKDTAFSLDYALLDQFGTLFTGANHSVEVSDSTVTATAVYSNGRATVDFAGFATAAAKTMTAKTFKSGADQSVGTTTEVTILAAANAAVSAISIAETDSFGTAASPRPLMLKDWNNADVRIGESAPASVANGITATASLTDANGNATRGPITFSGTDLLFADDDDQVYSSGSITVQSSTTGTYAVEVFSNTAGAKTLTVTSGGVTKTDIIYFESAKDDTGTTLTASAPANAAPGSTFSVVFTLTDKYGNPVTTDSAATNFKDGSADPAFSVTYSGPGLYMGTLPTKTDNNGQARVSVLLGQNDKGTVSVVANYDGNIASTTNTTVATVSASTEAGTAPVTQKVNAGSFKGYVAVYALGYEGQRLSAKIGNDWVIVDPIVNNQSANLARVTDFTGAGYDIAVRIYIDRVLTATIPLTTK